MDRLYDYGVTALSRLIAATAAQRLGLAPTVAHLDRTSFQVDGRYKRAEEPAAAVVHSTRGDRRDHCPDLNQVMLDLIVEHHADLPLLMQSLNGHSSDVQAFGQISTEHIKQLHTTYGTTSLVAGSALYSRVHHDLNHWSP